jgi:hypothetical protein
MVLKSFFPSRKKLETTVSSRKRIEVQNEKGLGTEVLVEE